MPDPKQTQAEAHKAAQAAAKADHDRIERERDEAERHREREPDEAERRRISEREIAEAHERDQREPEPLPTLSFTTSNAVTRLGVARGEVEAWTANLEKSLQADVDSGALTLAQASRVAEENDVERPHAPGKAPEAHETTPASNQAQMDAAAKQAAD